MPPRQDQFLKVLSRDSAEAAFLSALRPAPPGAEDVALMDLPGRVLAADIAAPVDAPPFDRATVDGFAVCAADLFEASATCPVTLHLNAETIHCGTDPHLSVAPGTATPIATGGPIPRGADAVVMIEHTEPEGDAIAIARAVAPGTHVSFAGSDIARGQTLLRRAAHVQATLPARLTSELGRTEFALVALIEGPEGLVAHPVAKGSGAVTAFAQADGFLTVPALAESLSPGTEANVTLFATTITPPRLTIVGSHCIGLDAVVGRLADAGVSARILATGSQGGLSARR
ncbi:MAG: hypothetical protein JJU24_16565 [Natronohydrobacter sp.]|nr:hypothetical protein [Natronohydrobacter sp.]